MNRAGLNLKRGAVWVWLALLLAAGPQAGAANSLTWSKEKNRVAADISDWNLVEVLERVAAATGWEVYVDPGAQRKVSTKFKDRAPDKALDLLLGNLSRVLLLQTNGDAPRLLVFRSREKEATQLVRPKPEDKTAQPIPNELVVTLKKGASIDELAKRLGAKVIGRADGLNAYRLQFEDAAGANAARDALRGNEDVTAVDNNYWAQRPEGSDGFNGAGAPALSLKPKAPADGKQQIIGLIDTAVQKTGANYDNFLLPAIAVAGETKLSETTPTHGTAMLENILNGLATGEKETAWKVLPVDVYGNNPNTTTFDVASGIFKAIEAGANPINLSLGSSGDSEFLHSVIKAGFDQGILFIAAAGNEPVATPTFPGAYPEVLAVTAIGPDGKVASYANFGSFVDLGVSGNSVITFNGQNWFTSGTSVSTAKVTGRAAAEARGGKISIDQIRAALQAQAGVRKP